MPNETLKNLLLAVSAHIPGTHRRDPNAVLVAADWIEENCPELLVKGESWVFLIRECGPIENGGRWNLAKSQRIKRLIVNARSVVIELMQRAVKQVRYTILDAANELRSWGYLENGDEPY